MTRCLTSGAIISPCGHYRYLLTRELPGLLSPMTFIMLNPSTADSDNDDPTIRRCMNFARLNESMGIRVVNLFAWRATDKSQLTRQTFAAAVGPDNDEYIKNCVRSPSLLVAAWGSHSGQLGKWVKTRALPVTAMCLQIGKPIFCLGVARDGQPRHPLYLRKDAQLKVWNGL